MTREDAKNAVIKAHWNFDDPIKELKNVVEKIYDDLSCENCKHFIKKNDSVGYCVRVSISTNDFNMVENDWYCKGIED